MDITISLNPSQRDIFDKWVAREDAHFAEDQKEFYEQKGLEEPAGGFPYFGAIGGRLTYHVTPTSLGFTIRVTHGGTNNTVDLTDYSEW